MKSDRHIIVCPACGLFVATHHDGTILYHREDEEEPCDASGMTAEAFGRLVTDEFPGDQDPYEKAWERWCVFTDACMCAPDTPRDATDLAARYQRYAGKVITPKEVEALMPERQGFPNT